MRKPTQILAPAFVLGALILGGYRLAAHSMPASQAIPGPGSAAAVVPSAPAARLKRTSEPAVTPAGIAADTSTAALVPTDAPSPTALPTATLEPSATPAPTVALEPTATEPAPTTAPTAAPSPAQAAKSIRQAAAAPSPTQALQPPTRIVAPAIGLDAKVVTMGWHEVQDPDGSSHTEWDVASYAAGWHKNSALPGEVGNTVISGHNNIEGEVFRNLEKFQVGDKITVYAGSRSFTYTVTEKFVVEDKNVPYEQRLANAMWIGPFDDERLTLVSCWPPTNNTHRMFVIAHPSSQP